MRAALLFFVVVLPLYACGDDSGGGVTAPSTGSLAITTTTTGQPSSGDAYSYVLDGGTPQPIGFNASITLTDLSSGSHEIELSGLPEGCTAGGTNPVTVTVTEAETAMVSFSVTCVPPVGTIQIAAASSGPAPATYALLLDGTAQGDISATASRTLASVPAGTHAVGLADVPANCQITEPNPQPVTVAAGATANVTFTVACTAPPAQTGILRITATTSGNDPDGYQVTVDGGAAQPLGANAAVTVVNVAAGSHTVVLADLESGCTVSGPNPRTVTVTPNAQANVAFVVTCAAPPPVTGSIKVTTTTSGPNPDPDGYSVAVDNGAAQPIATAGSVTVQNLSSGPHQVALSGLAANCTVASATQTVTVQSGATQEVTFAVTCTAVQTPSSRIAFSSVKNGNGAIMVVNPDGSDLIRLSPSAGGDFNPVWSPDGSKLLFRTSTGGLWVMNADGSGRTRLEEGDIFSYRWSPDGSRIAFTKERSEGEDLFEDLWVMQADGTGASRIATEGTYPSWSGDGGRIAYASSNLGDLGIHVINADGTGDTRITAEGVHGFQSAWAPDGSVIAFATLGEKDIVLIHPDGSGQINLTNGAADDEAPVWSPDSRRLVFTTSPADNALESEIAVMNRDGSGRATLTTHTGFDLSPDWSPDGTKIVYTQSGPSDSEVLVMNADGSAKLNVSNDPTADDEFADWGGQSGGSLGSRVFARSLLERRMR
jgi:WD40-like Beta Propeller Repeat